MDSGKSLSYHDKTHKFNLYHTVTAINNKNQPWVFVLADWSTLKGKQTDRLKDLVSVKRKHLTELTWFPTLVCIKYMTDLHLQQFSKEHIIQHDGGTGRPLSPLHTECVVSQ